jgi:hypothetical protein
MEGRYFGLATPEDSALLKESTLYPHIRISDTGQLSDYLQGIYCAICKEGGAGCTMDSLAGVSSDDFLIS